MDMKNNIFTLALLAALAVVSCTTKEDDALMGERQAMRFTASMGSYTKVTDSGFSRGDVVGLSVGKPVSVANVKLTAQDAGTLAPESTIYWGEGQTEASDFVAVYPFGSDPMKAFTFTAKADQSTAAAYEASDLLWAKTSAKPDDDEVYLPFYHGMSRFVLYLTSNLAGESVTGITLDGVKVGADVDLSKETFKATGSATSVKPATAADATGARAYVFVVAPQKATPDVVFTLSSGKTVKYTAKSAIDFLSGKQVTAGIVLSESEVSFTAEINDWDDGIKLTFGKVGSGEVPEGQEWNINMWDGYVGEWRTLPMERTDDGVYVYHFDDYEYSSEFELMLGNTLVGPAVSQSAYSMGEDGSVRIPLSAAPNHPSIYILFQGEMDLILDPSDFTLTAVAGTPRLTAMDLASIADGTVVTFTATVSEMLNLNYGNYYLYDRSGSVYVYGTKGSDGYPKDYENGWMNEAFGLIPNDKVTVKGEKTTYWGTVELVDVEIVSIDRKYPVGSAYGNYVSFSGLGQERDWFIRSEETPEYELRYNDGWLTCEVSQFTGDWYRVHLSAPASTSESDRFEDIVFSCSGVGYDLYVYQNPAVQDVEMIQPVVDAADGTEIIVTSQVYALSSRGFILYDGKYSILVYTGSNPLCQIGDIVRVHGVRTTYYNVPELLINDYEILSSSPETLMDVEYYDYTSEFYNNSLADITIPFSVIGSLYKDGSNYYVYVQDSWMRLSIYWPSSDMSEEIEQFVDQDVTVSGFYFGNNGDLHYMVVTGICESPVGKMCIIGSFIGSYWDKDFVAEEVSDGVWSITHYFQEGDNFKWRLYNDWGENYGAPAGENYTPYTPESGVPFYAEPGGANICIWEDGLYTVTLDKNDLLITVEKQEE